MVDFLYCNDIRVEQKSNGRKFAYCAYVRFFTGVGSFVHLKIAEVCCWIFTLVAMMCFLPSVFRNGISQRNKLTGWVVALSLWIFTLVADKWLFFHMFRHFVTFQTAGVSCSMITLVAMMWFLPIVCQNCCKNIYWEIMRKHIRDAKISYIQLEQETQLQNHKSILWQPPLLASPVRYIDMTYRLSIYRHFWKYRYRYGHFWKYRYRYR